jgi:spore coat polysaccharide biosynthesis protein SpsF
MDRKKMRKIATVEARMSSSRLPGKVLLPLAGKPSLERLVERARRAKSIQDVVIATTVSPKDDAIVEWAKKAGVSVFRGSEEDVLLRVLEAAKAYDGEVIVELTGDCPLLDPAHIDELVKYWEENDFDYVSNILERTYPRGFDTQVFARSVLEEVDKLTQDPADRENVSLYIYEHPQRYKLGGKTAPPDQRGADLRICTDMKEDYEVIGRIYDALYPKNPAFGAADIVGFLRANPDIAALNARIQQKKVRA